METNTVQTNLIQELRRGIIVLAVLAELQEEQYGYSILKLLAERGLDVEQGTLYPLLRRLEGQGLLESDWKIAEARPRRYYRISPEGRKVLEAMRHEWQELTTKMSLVLNSRSAGSPQDGSNGVIVDPEGGIQAA